MKIIDGLKITAPHEVRLIGFGVASAMLDSLESQNNCPTRSEANRGGRAVPRWEMDLSQNNCPTRSEANIKMALTQKNVAECLKITAPHEVRLIENLQAQDDFSSMVSK